MHEHTEMTLLLLAQAARDPSKAEHIEKRLATLVPEAVAEGRKLFAAQPKPELILVKKPVAPVAKDPVPTPKAEPKKPEPKPEPKPGKKGKR